jgi:DNA gyrase/topoisomerase IV subunit B
MYIGSVLQRVKSFNIEIVDNAVDEHLQDIVKKYE